MTIKCNKYVAAVANAVAYGFYTYIIVLTLCDLPMLEKCIITALANLVGVFVVKWVEEKAEKDKLWKIETTFNKKENFIHNLDVWAKIHKIPYNYIDIDKYIIVNFYSATQKESLVIKEFIKKFNGNYFVSETKNL
jgi:hypothetical protein